MRLVQFRQIILFHSLLVAVAVMSGCSSQLKYDPRDGREKVDNRTTSAKSSQSGGSCRSPYVVKSGDTLSGIAYQCDLNMADIAKHNDLLPPYIIYVNQELDLPHKDETQTVKKQPKQPVAAKPVKTTDTSTIKKTVKEQKTDQTTAKAIVREAKSPKTTKTSNKWQWPMHKGLAYKYRRDKAGLSVLEIYGVPGQKVRSVAPGKVVYSGNGIANYGWMLVIKHDNDYMSIYAHNSALLVQEGDSVNGGQEIALLGATGSTDRPKLYLEARYQGRKIDIKKKLKR